MTTFGPWSPVPEDDQVDCPACGAPARGQGHGETCVLPTHSGQPAPPVVVESDPAAARAVGELYREHRQPLLRFIRALAYRHCLPDPQRDAEDVLQAVFTAAIEQFPTLVNPPAWLYAVARNKLARAAADARRHGVVLDTGDLEAAGASAWTSLARRPDPQDVLLARQVVQEIARLASDQQRIATYLRHVQGWNTEEVAELLQCAPGTVWSHTHRGVTTVRSMVAPPPQSCAPPSYGAADGFPRGSADLRGGRSRRGCALAVVLVLLAVLVLPAVLGWIASLPSPWWQIGLAVLASAAGVLLWRAVHNRRRRT